MPPGVTDAFAAAHEEAAKLLKNETVTMPWCPIGGAIATEHEHTLSYPWHLAGLFAMAKQQHEYQMPIVDLTGGPALAGSPSSHTRLDSGWDSPPHASQVDGLIGGLSGIFQAHLGDSSTTATSAPLPPPSPPSPELTSMDSLPQPPVALSSACFEAALLEIPAAAENECFKKVFESLEGVRSAALTDRQLQLLLTLENDMIVYEETATGLIPNLRSLGLPSLQGGAAILASADGAAEVQACGRELCRVLQTRAEGLRAAVQDAASLKKGCVRESELQGARVSAGIAGGVDSPGNEGHRKKGLVRLGASGGRVPEVAEGVAAAVEETRERLNRRLSRLQTVAISLQHARGCASYFECNSFVVSET
jgi:hypothetical protein